MSLATSSSDAVYSALGWILIVFGVIAYWVPFIVVVLRRAPNIGQVAVVNGLLGWTLVGWVVALVMAVKPKPAQVYQAYPPYRNNMR